MASKKEISEQIIKEMIPADFKISFAKLKELIFANYKKANCGSSDRFPGKQGYSVFYTDNDNFMQGEKNGGGRGYFASLQGCGVCSMIKLSK